MPRIECDGMKKKLFWRNGAYSVRDEEQKGEFAAPTGNRTQGKCLEGIYVTTTPSAPC